MTDGAVRIRPEDTTHTPHAGQRVESSHPHQEPWHQGSAGTWTPSRARHRPPKEKASLTTIFDRLAKAAAAHDRDAAAEIFGETGLVPQPLTLPRQATR
jgi:hypothetical protein